MSRKRKINDIDWMELDSVPKKRIEVNPIINLDWGQGPNRPAKTSDFGVNLNEKTKQKITTSNDFSTLIENRSVWSYSPTNSDIQINIPSVESLAYKIHNDTKVVYTKDEVLNLLLWLIKNAKSIDSDPPFYIS